MAMEFPMCTVLLESLLKMKRLQRHEELLLDGLLHHFESHMGRAMFVSHQWLGSEHPDPAGEQLKVLQEALLELIQGRTAVSVPPGIEIVMGRQRCPCKQDFREPLYIWYDYFSCPQGDSCEACRKRQLAINSIAKYVAKSYFFVILCPTISSTEGKTLSYSTWASRGWCRAPAYDMSYII